jgi:hypothetical protein
MKNFNEKLRNQLRSELHKKLYKQIDRKLAIAVHLELDSQIGIQPCFEINKQLKRLNGR